MKVQMARAPELALSRPRMLYGLGLGLFGLSLLIVKLDTDFSLRWSAFNLWLAAVATCGLTLRWQMVRAEPVTQARAGGMAGWYVFMFAALTRFALLSRYPFFTLNDPLRDGGWDAMRIVNGNLQNIFAYGRYESHGLLIPVISSLFFRIFGNSDLTFKVPAALIATADITLVYLLVRQSKDRVAALFAALFLICMPLHLFYARTEIVVICSSALMTGILLSLRAVQRRKSAESLALLGLVLGVCMNFHASIRTVVFMTVPIAICFAIAHHGWRRAAPILGAALLMLMVGFGPRILMSSFDILFHTKTVTMIDKSQPAAEGGLLRQINLAKAKDVAANYRRSLLAYFYEGISSHYKYKNPLLPFVVGLCFVVGLVYALVEGDAFWRACGVYALAIPLTNSAITEAVNADHRLAPLFPLAAILAGYGASVAGAKIRRTSLRAVLALALVASSGGGLHAFYNQELATHYPENYQGFMVTYLAGTVKASGLGRETLCIKGSKATLDFLKLGHIREYLEYMLPGTKISHEEIAVGNEHIHLYASCAGADDADVVIYCQQYVKYLCPQDRKPIFFYVGRRR